MSLSADRAAIATALDAVADVTGYDDWPAQMAVGDAWVRWGGFSSPNAPLVFECAWVIGVVTGGTPGDAMVWLDSHLALILDAIDSLVYLVSVLPVEYQTPSGTLYGAEITAKKES